MDGDKLEGTTARRNVDIADSEGTVRADAEPLAGSPREQVTYPNATSNTEIFGSITDYSIDEKASQTVPGGVLKSNRWRQQGLPARHEERGIGTDPETGEQAAKVVEQVFVHDDTLVDLVIDGESITTTEDHPFWSVTDRRFEPAAELAPGEEILAADGRSVRVSGLATQTAHLARAYNLSVADIHTYHVVAGTAEVLVHNAAPEGCRITSSATSPVLTSKTVTPRNITSYRIDLENPAPGQPGAAQVHVQFMGRGADPTKYYLNPDTKEWISEQGKVLKGWDLKQIDGRYVKKALDYLGVTPP